MALMVAFPEFFLSWINYFGKQLHHEQLESKIYWLLGSPAGFKPNLNLNHFLGNLVLSLIYVWNHVTSALTRSRIILLYGSSVFGVLGLSV